MEAATPGLLLTNAGQPTKCRYLYASFWIDNYYSFIYVTMHESKEAIELVKSKCEFESFAAKYNIPIQHIRADNGAYSAAAFKISCDARHQKLSFCAVGSHWQNGIAEGAIGVVQSHACTILLHAIANWPLTVNESFWPYAVRHAVNLHNCSIRQDHSKSPWELFTNELPPFNLEDFREFGSPVYILQKALQDGSSVPKWTPRSRQGIYVGFSTSHAGKVALIHDPRTTHVSPQYHVVFDEYFSSVSGPPKENIDKFLEKIYKSAAWLSSSSIDDSTASASKQYHFDTFWSDPESLPLPSTTSRKRPLPPDTTSTQPANHNPSVEPADNPSLQPPPSVKYNVLQGSSAF